MHLKPLSNKVIVKPQEADEKTSGGLFIPETAKEKPSRGVVVSIGPGKTYANGVTAEMDIKPGDVVLYSKYAGDGFKDGDDELFLLSQDDVIAVIED